MRYLVLLAALLASSCAHTDRFSPALPMPTLKLPGDTLITRIALGSCFHPSRNGDIFDEITAQNPDVFLFLGDNVYAADESFDLELNSLRAAYFDLAQVESFQTLRSSVPMMVIWDDHDYGKDDAGGDWSNKNFSESLYQHVWAIDDEDPRTQLPGVYLQETIGPEGQQVQIIMLDVRFFRTPLTRNPDQDIGRYTPSQAPNQNMLGDAQWQWFKEQLEKPADVRIIVTPIQLIADGHYWEAWRMMPKERQRFYDLLAETKPNGAIIVSGDRHSAAMYKREGILPYPLYELTTSSLNVPLTLIVKDPQDEPGPHRLFAPFYESNYALIDIDWGKNTVTLQILDQESRSINIQTLSFGELTANQGASD